MIDFVASNERGKFSYCTYCIESHDFYPKDGIYVCEKCKRPLKTAHECAEKQKYPVRLENDMVQL